MKSKILIARILMALLVIAFLIHGVHWSELLQSVMLQIQEYQRIFHDRIIDNMQQIEDGNDLHATLMLSLIGFLYGVIHAIGPGHGKFVITSYLMASRSSLRRGILLTVLSSLVQAVTAIVLVVGLAQIIHLTHQNAEPTTRWLEVFSYGVIAFLGIALLRRGMGEMRDYLSYHHHDDCGCGHHHAPAPDDIKKDWRSMAVIILSIGIRPCSGAILLLLFANLLNVVWAGVIATFAMAIGTAISTSALAALAVYSKNLALKFAKASDHKILAVHAGISLFFGAAILIVSLLFIAANLSHPAAVSAPNPIFGIKAN